MALVWRAIVGVAVLSGKRTILNHIKGVAARKLQEAARKALQAELESLETELHGVRMTVLYSDRQILVLETQE